MSDELLGTVDPFWNLAAVDAFLMVEGKTVRCWNCGAAVAYYEYGYDRSRLLSLDRLPTSPIAAHEHEWTLPEGNELTRVLARHGNSMRSKPPAAC